mmetsp:Transcript_23877/g.73087  ORF Transcript_23877/g.73087 Transcript_23877/m.73087 type:complete len:227 (+) Transcript_23877:1477-2157(+)
MRLGTRRPSSRCAWGWSTVAPTWRGSRSIRTSARFSSPRCSRWTRSPHVSTDRRLWSTRGSTYRPPSRSSRSLASGASFFSTWAPPCDSRCEARSRRRPRRTSRSAASPSSAGGATSPSRAHGIGTADAGTRSPRKSTPSCPTSRRRPTARGLRCAPTTRRSRRRGRPPSAARAASSRAASLRWESRSLEAPSGSPTTTTLSERSTKRCGSRRSRRARAPTRHAST